MTSSRLQFLEHTADVGFDVAADTLPELFRSAASGMFQLLLGDEYDVSRNGGRDRTEQRVHLQAGEPALLLHAWLRELLYFYESEDLAPVNVDFRTLDAHMLDAAVTLMPPSSPPLREIKGVTYHQLHLRQDHGQWHARVIFDV